MKIDYDVNDELVIYFSEKAKDCLKEQSEKYTVEIIKAAEADGKLFLVPGAQTEITESNVLQGVKSYKIVRKRGKAYRIFRILGEIGLLISGIMFLPDKIDINGEINLVYLSIWILIILLSFIFTIYSHFLGGE